VIRAAACTAAALAAFLLPAAAHAAGGRYVIDGGTQGERHEVVDALNASSFDWGAVPATVQIHIVRGQDSYSTPGEIWLDADLLDAGTFAWGVVQHEYAHQVDYLRFDDAIRGRFLRLLGASEWCYSVAPVLDHAAYGCERFASTLAWAYWQSPENCMKPTSSSDESAAVSPRRFRAALDAVLAHAVRKTPR
jgi:hypothetical protein